MNRQKILVFAAVAVVALFAADKIVFTPLTNAWKDRSDEIRKLRSNVESGRSLQRRELGLRGHWEEMKSNALPENPSLTEQQVLNAFNRWAQDSRVSITSVTPQWKHDSDDYTTLQCRVEASGNLGYITRFLYEIEKDPMALRLDTMEISSRDNDGQQLALAIQASALVLPHPLPRQ
ncbi:MAG TPA: hypothetical protein VLT36_13400 [Candidatus Dormibacteraeota bacterium]|nr:hypothetical protein [Candidatus Dormibacteraeota bacterium]